MSQGFGSVVKPSPSPTLKRLKGIILEEFKGLDDPRVKRESLHLLIDIVTIAVLAILCGADSMVAIETYGKQKQKWLKTF